jgi:ComF family protein
MRGLVSLAAPPRCVACSAPTQLTAVLCRRCDAALAAARPGESTLAGLPVRWASDYRGVARELVRALKFGRRTAAAEPMARTMATHLFADVALVPVPAAPARRRQRGFDPAEALAHSLARAAGLELSPCLARRDGRRQVGRSRWDRLADPPQVRLAAPPPRAALLVDDVFTTGATLAACANAMGDALRGACAFARARSIV